MELRFLIHSINNTKTSHLSGVFIFFTPRQYAPSRKEAIRGNRPQIVDIDYNTGNGQNIAGLMKKRPSRNSGTG